MERSLNSIHRFWHWLTTSRYTRNIEQQVIDLKARNSGLERDLDALMSQMYPQYKAAKQQAAGEKKSLPASMGWQVR